MDFDLSGEQKLIRRAVGEFARGELAPRVREIDEGGRIPDDVISSLAQLGVLGMTVSEAYGGVGADPVTAGVVAEELAKGDFSCAVPTFFLVQAAWGFVFDKYADERLKELVLPNVVAGKAFLGIASTEPDAGSDVANIKTVAKRTKDGYELFGEKMFISGVREVCEQLPEGGGHITLAKTDPDAPGAKGISAFFVPIRDANGVATTLLDDWGRRGISSGGFAMDGTRIPRHFLLGEEGRGFYIAMEGFDFARALIAVVCCGAAEAALQRAADHIKSRTAFGVPIGRFEGVQFKLAEHWALLEAIKLSAYRALWLYGLEQRGEGVGRFEVSMACAQAKMLAPQAAFDAVNDAIQWFGAYGYTTDCELELALKGIRSYFWAEGALEIMKIIVARELLGKDFVAYR